MSVRTLTAASTSPVPAALLAGGVRRGSALGTRFVDLDGYVLALTPPGAGRLPNGVEATVALVDGEPVAVGHGALRTGSTAVHPGPCWDPVPDVRFVPVADEPLDLALAGLAGWGPGLTPLGDDLRCGFLAGHALLGTRVPCRELPVGGATTSLSRTLLRHARRGELPEPAHALLTDGDPGPLLAWGATSGRGMLVGLALAAQTLGVPTRPAVPSLGAWIRIPTPTGDLDVRCWVRRVG